MRGAGVLVALFAIGMLWLVPFLWPEHRVPLTSFDSELIAQACLALLMAAGATLGDTRARIRWPLPAFLLAVAAIAAAQYLLHRLPYSQQAVGLGWIAAAMLCAYVLGRQLVAAGMTESAVRAACLASLAGALVSVAIQWLQLFEIHILPSWLVLIPGHEVLGGRPPGNLEQANHLATYIAAGALAAACLQARGMRAAWGMPAFLALGSGLGLAGSRVTLMYLALIAACLLLPSGLRPARARARCGLVVALLAGYALGPVAVRAAYSGAEMTVFDRLLGDTYGIRTELWRQAWAIALQHPLIGAGAGQFPAAQYWIARSTSYAQGDVNCHNLVLQLAAEMGWPAALAAVAVALWWALSNLKKRLASPEGAYAWGFLALIAIHSLLEYPLWYLYFAVPAAMLFALAEPDGVRELRLDLRRSLALLGAAFLVAALLMRFDYDDVVRASDRFWSEKRAHSPVSAETVSAVIAAAQSALFRPEGERLLIELQPLQEQQGDAYLELSARVLSRQPHPQAILRHILLLVQAGRVDEAVPHVDRLRVFARERFPQYRDAILDATRDLGPRAARLRRALRATS